MEAQTTRATAGELPATTGEAEQQLGERYRASMVLAGVGDAMGYRNGAWEFTFDGACPPPPLFTPLR
jgi:hypothetical protein